MMKNRLTLLNLFFLLSIAIANAQEGLPFYEHYLVTDKYYINPSYAGATDDVVIRGSYRNQWGGIADAPSTAIISAHANVIDRLGAGFYVFQDKNGATSLTGVNLTAAYHIPIDDGEDRKESQFSFGLSYFGLNQSFDFSKLNPEDPSDPLLNGEQSSFQSYFNVGASFAYKNFFGGVSIQDIPLGDNSAITNVIEPLPTWYYFNAGYKYAITENIELEPSLLLNLNSNAERQLDINLKGKVKFEQNSVMVGASYRQDLDKNGVQRLHISPLVGLELGRLKIGYAYNIGLSKIALEGNNGHLISLGYDLENFFNPDYR